MKGQTASLLIVLALVVGAGVGALAGTSSGNVTVVESHTTVESYTTTVTVQGSAALRCVVTLYQTWDELEVSGSSTFITTTNVAESRLQTFTTTGPLQAVGYSTTVTTEYYTGVTLTGPINEWNSTVCASIPG